MQANVQESQLRHRRSGEGYERRPLALVPRDNALADPRREPAVFVRRRLRADAICTTIGESASSLLPSSTATGNGAAVATLPSIALGTVPTAATGGVSAPCDGGKGSARMRSGAEPVGRADCEDRGMREGGSSVATDAAALGSKGSDAVCKGKCREDAAATTITGGLAVDGAKSTN